MQTDYQYLRKAYAHRREDYGHLRRHFDMRLGDQKTDIWEFPPNYLKYDHPTIKPVGLIEHIVRLSCRPGGTVVDPFMGSGTTGVACANLGRKFIGVEKDPKNLARQQYLWVVRIARIL